MHCTPLPLTWSGPFRLLEVRARQYVPLADMDTWIHVFEREAGPQVHRVDALHTCGMRICRFGAIDIVGLAAPWDDPVRRPGVTARIAGMATLLNSLRLHGAAILCGPEPCETGLRLVTAVSGGASVEYFEAFRP